MAKNSLLNPDDFINDPLFSELRAFGNSPIQGKEHELGQLMAAFSQATPKARFNLTKFFGIGALAIGLGVPSLAYAGLLPHQISSNVKIFVTSVGSVVTKPVTSIVQSITSNGQGDENSPSAPTSSPSGKSENNGDSGSKSDSNAGSGDAKIATESSDGEGDNSGITVTVLPSKTVDGKNSKNENHSQEKSNESDHKHPTPSISLTASLVLPSISGVGELSGSDNSDEQDGSK
jgi:hypothetical protein